jgi:glucokinase
MMPSLLVADIGGTNARFATATRREGRICIEDYTVLAGGDFQTFDDALQHYLDLSGAKPALACIAAAGPVLGGAVHLTNRKWTVSEAALRERFGFSGVTLFNDFVAMARSVPEMGADAFLPVFDGEAVRGAPVLVTGPGTGFGVATLVPLNEGWKVLGGEGGHMAYAPRTALERELAGLLMRDHGYVSNELVASGSGLNAVHAAFCEMFDIVLAPLTPAEMSVRAGAGDEMYQALIQVRALAVMGAAGDLVLANGALGGVVLAGGVSEKFRDIFLTSEARERFVARGPMSRFLERCPVRLLHEDTAPLIGAAAQFEQMRDDH